MDEKTLDDIRLFFDFNLKGLDLNDQNYIPAGSVSLYHRYAIWCRERQQQLAVSDDTLFSVIKGIAASRTPGAEVMNGKVLANFGLTTYASDRAQRATGQVFAFDNGLTEAERDKLDDLITDCVRLIHRIEELRRHRSYSLAITQLEQAKHWLEDRKHKPA